MQEVRAVPAPGCWFTVEHRGAATVVRFTDLDMKCMEAAEAMSVRLFRLAEGVGRRLLVLNFDSAPVLTSGLLGKLITLNKKVRNAGGLLMLCSLGPSLQSQFERTRLNSVFTICTNEQEALQAAPR